MDTEINEWDGSNIDSYRFRSARQRERMRYEDFDKALLKIHRQENELWDQRNNLGWEPLDPPVQKGWKRFYVLRDDVALSKHALFFENILQKINTYDWSSKKQFLAKKRKRGRKIYVERKQHLKMPCAWEFRRMDFNDNEKQFFHVEPFVENWNKELRYRYVFNEPWRFVLRVRPNMIDKIRIKDAELESRIKAIDNYLEKNDYRRRLNKLLNGDAGNHWRKYETNEKEAYCYKNKPMTAILDLIKAENE